MAAETVANFETTINVSDAAHRRGDVVLQKWVDKNTLVNAGDLLVGTGNATTVNNIPVADVTVLPAGTVNYPLVSRGPNLVPSYSPMQGSSLVSGSVNATTKLTHPTSIAPAGSVYQLPLFALDDALGGGMTVQWGRLQGYQALEEHSIRGAQIANAAIDTAQIADAAVGPVQIANMAVETKIGLETSFSTGSASAPVNITGKYGLYSVMVPDFHVNNDQYYAGNPGLLSFLFEYNSIMQAAVYKTYMSDSFSVLNYYLPVGYKIIKSASTPYTYTPEYTDMIQLVIEPVNSSGSITGVQMGVYHVWIPSSPNTTTPSREQLAFQYRRLISFNQ